MVGYRRARHVLDLITAFIPNAYVDLPKRLLSKQTWQGGHDVICPLQLLVRGESAENNDALICCGDSRAHEERFLLDPQIYSMCQTFKFSIFGKRYL